MLECHYCMYTMKNLSSKILAMGATSKVINSKQCILYIQCYFLVTGIVLSLLHKKGSARSNRGSVVHILSCLVSEGSTVCPLPFSLTSDKSWSLLFRPHLYYNCL